MYLRSIDTFIHQLRAGRDETPKHDDLRQLYERAIEATQHLANGVYKKQRAQVDENLV